MFCFTRYNNKRTIWLFTCAVKLIRRLGLVFLSVWKYSCWKTSHKERLDMRALPIIDHSGSAARRAKKISVKSYLRTLVVLLLQSHAFLTVLIPISWENETLKILLWSCSNSLKVNWVKYPSINTCQHSSIGKAWAWVPGSIPVKGNFLLNLFISP